MPGLRKYARLILAVTIVMGAPLIFVQVYVTPKFAGQAAAKTAREDGLADFGLAGTGNLQARVSRGALTDGVISCVRADYGDVLPSAYIYEYGDALTVRYYDGESGEFYRRQTAADRIFRAEVADYRPKDREAAMRAYMLLGMKDKKIMKCALRAAKDAS